MTLEEARKMLGWTQARLADVANDVIKDNPISKGTISDIETGRNENPSYAVVMKIMKALHDGGLRGVTAEDIFPIEDKAGTAR